MSKPILYFAHVRNFANSGDMISCPFWPFRFYFREKFDCRFIDISDRFPFEGDKINGDDFLIVGGGGLDGYHDEWHDRINSMAEKAKKSILWGVGSNRNPRRELKASGKIDLSLFDLVGLRDVGPDFLPCVSCLYIPDEILEIEATKNCGLVHHLEADFNCSEVPANCDVTTNSRNYEALFKFIRQHRFIISDSYHICYWSVLLERPIYRLHANDEDSRFANFKFKLPRWTGSRSSAVEEIHSDFLAECRKLNNDFFEKAKSILN